MNTASNGEPVFRSDELSPLAPLLVEPARPWLETQSATEQGAADLAETAQWRYHMRYWHEHTAQDEVFVTVSLNVPPPSDDETAIATDGMPPRVDHVFVTRLVHSNDGERIEALLLTREKGQGSSGSWPSADFRSSAGSVVDLGNGVGEGAERRYAFDPPIVVEGGQMIGLAWDGLDVTHAQNARTSLMAVRNRGLGADDIVYRTPTLDAQDVVTPLNRWSQPIDISDLGASVEAALDAVFATLFGDRRIGQPVTLGLSYGYQVLPVVDVDVPLMAYLPVGLYPNQPIGATTAAQIAATLRTWMDESNPPTTGGVWMFSLVQFSQVETRAPQPLLELGRLVYRLR
jgi:hypothetical protein